MIECIDCGQSFEESQMDSALKSRTKDLMCSICADKWDFEDEDFFNPLNLIDGMHALLLLEVPRQHYPPSIPKEKIPKDYRTLSGGRKEFPNRAFERIWEYLDYRRGLEAKIWVGYFLEPMLKHIWIELPGDVVFDGTTHNFYEKKLYYEYLKIFPVKMYTEQEFRTDNSVAMKLISGSNNSFCRGFTYPDIFALIFPKCWREKKRELGPDAEILKQMRSEDARRFRHVIMHPSEYYKDVVAEKAVQKL